jgi:tetratricopeptide (TPR) repeat protein
MDHVGPQNPDSEVEQLDCFVVIGFGRKTDFATGRVLDLDKTYSELIAPSFDKVNERQSAVRIHCFRAIDVNRSGSIDKIMYHWIYHADIVVADLSTMNANVMYELGVRHAQRPNTSILMAENDIFRRIPFDLSHSIIHGYDHLGDSIAPEEIERFTNHLADLVLRIIENPLSTDSPVYTYLEGMTPPQYVPPAERIRQLEEASTAGAGPDAAQQQALAILVDQAQSAMGKGDFETAGALLGAAMAQDSTDPFLRQRLALCTYKAKDKAEDDETAIRALEKAESILEPLRPSTSTDPETLGLSGAIRKRMWERTGDPADLDLAIGFYERVFYISQDYYNGINVAYLYNVKADIAEDLFEAIIDFGHAKRLRQGVAKICRDLIESEDFEGRGDREWVYQTLAQAYLGDDREQDAEALTPTISALSGGSFSMDTFLKQNASLLEMIQRFKERSSSSQGPFAAAGRPGKSS